MSILHSLSTVVNPSRRLAPQRTTVGASQSEEPGAFDGYHRVPAELGLLSHPSRAGNLLQESTQDSSGIKKKSIGERLDSILLENELQLAGLTFGLSLLHITCQALQHDHTEFLLRLPSIVQTLVNNSGDAMWGMLLSVAPSLPLMKIPYAKEAVALLAATYFTLGESIAPQIIPGNYPALSDIPAALFGVGFGYLMIRLTNAIRNNESSD